MPVSRSATIETGALFVAAVVVLAVSGIAPADRLTWVLETFPIMLGLPVLLATWRRFPLTPLLYRLLLLHAVILAVGGHYTYAEVPLGFWVQDLLDLARNHYDRLGHLAQGFIPAVLVRELLVRTGPLAGSRWLAPLCVACCLAFSALYELIEWAGALVFGASATAFLGTQGDPWDTQWDMLLALLGAILALALLSRLHDRQLAQMGDAGTS